MSTAICTSAAVLFLGVASLLRSCGTEVVGLVEDPSFTYARAVSEGMVIGGVVYSIGPEEYRDMLGDEATNQLRISLVKNRDDLNVLPQGTVLAAVGNEAYERILYDYERGASLDDWHVETLRGGLAGRARYVIFSRVEEDYVYTGRRFYTEDDKENLELSTYRRITASFRVYDVSDGRTVWRGLIQKSESNPYLFTREVGTDEEENVTWTDVVLGAVVDDPTVELRYPDPPQLAEVLSPLFAGFADNLPHAERS